MNSAITSLPIFGLHRAAQHRENEGIVITAFSLHPGQRATQKRYSYSLPLAFRMTARNRSGVVGVHLRSDSIRKASGKEYEYRFWVARWPGCRLKAGGEMGCAQFR